MALSYPLRMICLCFASFFLVNLAAGLLLAGWSPRVCGYLERLRPGTAGRLLFVLRLLPGVLAATAVAAFCAPSFLVLEKVKAEHVSWFCVLAAALGASLCLGSLRRGLRALFISWRYRAVSHAATTQVAGTDVTMIAGERPLVAMVGLFRPRIVITGNVVTSLTPEQLELALRHEQAHARSRDNCKRLAVLAAPDLFPGSRIFRALERTWERVTEFAADDAATGNDAALGVALASALVQVARMGAAPRPTPLATSLVEESGDLSHRVERLLDPTPRPDPTLLRRGLWPAAAAAMLMILVIAPQHATLHFVHEAMERLIH